MSILERVNADQVAAMKAREKEKVSALRLLKAELAKTAKDQGGALDGEAEVRVVRKLVKQREEAAQAFREAGRAEQAAQEEAELALINSYLPAAVPEAKIQELIDAVVAETGAAGPREIGKVMKALMPRLQELGGLVDGKQVNQLVRQKLG